MCVIPRRLPESRDQRGAIFQRQFEYAGGWIMTRLTPLDRMFLRSIGLNHAEAALVCEALQAGVTSPQGDFLWREVELAMRLDGLDAKYEIDGPGLVQKLRKR